MKKKNVAERLRESKEASNKRMFERGLKVGREWAEESATAEELEMLAVGNDSEGYGDIYCVADFLEVDQEELTGDLDRHASRSAQFAEGFVTGALVVFAEHAEIFDVDLATFHIE